MKLEKGKYYTTADGVKVGPKGTWSNIAEHAWEQAGGSSIFDPNGDIWREDGFSAYDVPRLVAEWSDPATA